MRYFKGWRFKRAFLPLAVILVGFTAALAQTHGGKKNIDFIYAFGAYAGPPGKGKIISVQNETSLRTGDRLKVFFEPKSDQYFYLLHLSSQGELTSLYPAAGQVAKVGKGTRVFIPADMNWFELDGHPGQEKFFFIAAADPLNRLEELCIRHAVLKEKTELQLSTDAILDEIRRLRQENKQLSAPAEKPMRIGGSVRGQQASGAPAFADITPLAAEIKAPGFYSRTFTIDHR
jgi:hypothetical protein